MASNDPHPAFIELKGENADFQKFCRSVFVTKEIELTQEEMAQFETFRQKDASSQRWRNVLFWPTALVTAVYIDAQIIVPYTKTNRTRVFWNLVLSTPLVFFGISGIVFNQQFESREYAKQLLQKYSAAPTGVNQQGSDNSLEQVESDATQSTKASD